MSARTRAIRAGLQAAGSGARHAGRGIVVATKAGTKPITKTAGRAGRAVGRGAKATGRVAKATPGQVLRGLKGQGIKYDAKRLRAVMKGQRVTGGVAGTGRLTRGQAAKALGKSAGRTALVYGGAGTGVAVAAKARKKEESIFTPLEREALQDAVFEALMEQE